MKSVLAALLLIATTVMAQALELDDKHFIARPDRPLCMTIAAVDRWVALSSAGQKTEAQSLPQCLSVKEGTKILIVDRDFVGYTKGLWRSASGAMVDVWTISFPNMTEKDFAEFYCSNGMPECTPDQKAYFDGVEAWAEKQRTVGNADWVCNWSSLGVCTLEMQDLLAANGISCCAAQKLISTRR